MLVKNIGTEENINVLKKMIFDHYNELIGPDWALKIPFQKLRENTSDAHRFTNKDVKDIMNPNSMYKTTALGIINEENNDIMGLALLDLIYDENLDKRYGQVYQLYIKPEYRASFSMNHPDKDKLISEVNDSINTYFKNHDIDEIIMLVPENIEYLISLSKELGFQKEREIDNQTIKVSESIKHI